MGSRAARTAVAAALRGTALDGHPVKEGLGGTFLVGGVEPAHLLDAWRAARSVLPVTGRWPVLTGVGELYHEPDAAELAALVRAARTVDPWTVYRRHRDPDPIPASDLAWRFSGILGGLDDRAAQELDLPTTQAAIDRWVWDTVLADPALTERCHRATASLVGTRQWYTPREVQLVLLPTPQQWLAPAWVTYFGAARPQGPEALAAAILQWEHEWGAELVACWATMLQFVVPRRPPLGEPAWRLAEQLMAVGGSLQTRPWELATALTRTDAWFLHDRP